ncbi:hypothetical protein Tco_0594105 [Tanacetum coccineum]
MNGRIILYDDPIDDLIFRPGDDIDEIDTFLDVDIPTDIEDGYHDSEGDINYLESLLSDNTTLSLPPKLLSPDFEGSRAHGLSIHILEASYSQLHLGNQYPNLID